MPDLLVLQQPPVKRKSWHLQCGVGGREAEERHLNMLGIAGHLLLFPPEVFCRRPLRTSSRVHFVLSCRHSLSALIGRDCVGSILASQ